jgi:hypothetical protein
MSFDIDIDGMRHFFEILFQYGADEQTIHVGDLGYRTEWIEDLLEP